ncbi:hypothetical protein BXZ70DRAFT_99987 [Cristinia sonorae]|uniref:Uncharacterized protein n=1 Tax=Cristinia sonorae TaxID=1940300 RepID=A0A8K0UQA0_9AGAR|nr:hypothetical protein BXZ70DRAFT_99987 [Cristinia sonorae]
MAGKRGRTILWILQLSLFRSSQFKCGAGCLTCLLYSHFSQSRHRPLSLRPYDYRPNLSTFLSNTTFKMHASTVVAIALVCAAAPTLSAPASVSDSYARDTTSTTSSVKVAAPAITIDESGAFKINTGLIKDGVDIFNGIVQGAQGIKDFFTDKREIIELITRVFEDDFVARDVIPETDESGAFKINTGLIKEGVDIANGVISAAHGIKDFFTGDKRELAELVTRALEEEMIARDVAPVDESGAFDFGILKDAFSIGKGIFNGVQGIHDLFSSNSQQQQQQKREEFVELLARALEDDVVMARDDSDDSGAFKINTGLIKEGVDIFNGVVQGAQGIKDFFSHDNNNQQRSELFEREPLLHPIPGLPSFPSFRSINHLPVTLKVARDATQLRRPHGLLARPPFRIGTVIPTKREENLNARASTFDLGRLRAHQGGIFGKPLAQRSLDELD